MDLFKKREEEPQVEMSQEETDILVAEIHETFLTEVDKLLDFANNRETALPENAALTKKAERLRKLGFSKAKPVSEIRDDEARVAQIKIENQEKAELKKAILYFSAKYPYKFITEESVHKICEKYGLVYGPAEHYIGDVPERNLAEMEKFSIEEKDQAVRVESEYSDNYAYTNIKEMKRWRKKPWDEDDYDAVNEMEKASLFIAAPEKAFDQSNLVKKGNKLDSVPAPDPIVLQPIIYGSDSNSNEGYEYQKLGYLIVTAWGPESMEPEVFNGGMN